MFIIVYFSDVREDMTCERMPDSYMMRSQTHGELARGQAACAVGGA